MAQNCGNEDEPCCFTDEKYTCKDSSLICVLRGSENVCMKVGSGYEANTCICGGKGWFNSKNCNLFEDGNYCDVSKGEKAYCVYNKDKKCGYDINKELYGTCRCATPEQASSDKELNGYWKNYKEGTCVVGFVRKGLNEKYYIDHNYCKKGYEPRIYTKGTGYSLSYGDATAVCECVETGYEDPKFLVPDGSTLNPISSNKIIEKPIEGGRSAITQLLYGTNYKLYCEGNDKNNPTIQTSLGCIPITTKGFIAWLLPILFSIAGTVAFLIMVGGFISLSTSEGDPKKMQAAKDTITAAITGLLISLFAIFIVRFIIAYVLKIPGA